MTIGILVFDDMTQLDATGPDEALARKALTGRVLRQRSAAQADRAFLVVQAAQRHGGTKSA